MLQYFMKTFNYTYKNKPLDTIIDFNLFKNKENILIQIFCGDKRSVLQEISSTLLKELPQAVCIGSSTDGEIKNSKVSTLKTIISISVFEHTTIKTTYKEGRDCLKKGKDLASELMAAN